MVSKSLVLGTLAVFATSALGCGYSQRGDGFEMYVYADTNCATDKGYEQFYGHGDNPACDCYNLGSKLNDKVKSFTYTASDSHQIWLYKDANCKGTDLGRSVGSWMDKEVSSAGQGMSSFKICLTIQP
ncbi:hypothetical protein HYDPIDRAFT_109142 [Hydnomerulius pinastri MD-312]|nr:hypothetical protein HYDPIDRAFT_109142 [Hydnomerulius pinastri MD-312]